MNRGTVWSDKEVQALIAIWGESSVQEELDGAARNQAVYQRIAKQLREQGYDRDWKQCRAKIKNLKTKYREIKDHNGETGRGRKTRKFYTELDRILGHRPASVPSSLLDTGDSSSTLVESQESEEIDGKSISSMSKEYIPLYDHVYLQMELKCRLIHLLTVLPPKLKELMVKN